MLHLDKPEGGKGRGEENFVNQGRDGSPMFEITRKSKSCTKCINGRMVNNGEGRLRLSV